VAKKPSTTAFAILLIAIASIGAVVGVLMGRHGRVKASGTVVADRTAIGSFSFGVNDCEAGTAMVPSFMGAALHGEGDYSMRVVDTGDKARIWLYSQGGRQGSVAITKTRCVQWDVVVASAHTTINRVEAVNGHIRIACAVGGGSVKADVNFERCAR
jgi:hypothetical protein